jgi:hypothetical protein
MPANWADLEQLFGPRGASAGCWCMWWRMKRSEWERNKGEKNRRAFQKIVSSNVPTGVLAYLGNQPIGCAQWRRAKTIVCSPAPECSVPGTSNPFGP